MERVLCCWCGKFEVVKGRCLLFNNHNVVSEFVLGFAQRWIVEYKRLGERACTYCEDLQSREAFAAFALSAALTQSGRIQ